MCKIKIVTDSTAYIDKLFIEKHDIGIVPLAVNFEESIKDEGLPGDFGVFFDRLSKSPDFPTTSQPPVGKFAKIFKDALQDGYEIIAIIMSSKLSGTFNSASTAAKIVDPTENKISLIDSLTTAANLKFLIKKAVSLAKKGASMKQIVEKIEMQKRHMGIRLTVSTLEYLKRGGRLSTTEAMIGSLLNIKPIIGLIDGELKALNRAHGKKKAMDKMLEDVPANVSHISICHIEILEKAKEYEKLIQKRFPEAKTEICEVGPVIGSHLGPETIGICYVY
ncbi:MAG: DegV family protein [Alkaliphilus sp.]|nr:DegV family protein [Alkaliphilus sp.]